MAKIQIDIKKLLQFYEVEKLPITTIAKIIGCSGGIKIWGEQDNYRPYLEETGGQSGDTGDICNN